MSFEKLKKRIEQIAMENPDGFTYSIVDDELIGHGIPVAYAETQNSFNQKGLLKSIKHALKNDKLVGGWLDGKKFYYDSVKLFENETEALEFAKANGQKAIYVIHEKRTIWV